MSNHLTCVRHLRRVKVINARTGGRKSVHGDQSSCDSKTVQIGDNLLNVQSHDWDAPIGVRSMDWMDEQ